MRTPTAMKVGNLMFIRIELEYQNKTEAKYLAAASYCGVWTNDIYTLSEVRAKWSSQSDYREYKDFQTLEVFMKE